MEEKYSEKFSNYLKAEDLSSGTINNYIFSVKKFVKYFEENIEAYSPEKVNAIDLIDYRNFLIKKGKSDNYINNSLAALKKYFDYINIELDIENPSIKVKKIKIVKTYYNEILSLKDFKKLRREIYISAKKRDKLIFDLLSNTGIRISELINLKISDIVISERLGYLKISISKGMKSRKVPLNRFIREELEEYIYSHEFISEYMFYNASKRKLVNKSTINKMLSKHGAKVEIKVYPHLLRHFFATQYLEANQYSQTSLVNLQKILGHQSITTTMHYLHFTEDNDQIENLKF